MSYLLLLLLSLSLDEPSDKSSIIKFLSAWLASRPKQEDLKSKGVIKGTLKTKKKIFKKQKKEKKK